MTDNDKQADWLAVYCAAITGLHSRAHGTSVSAYRAHEHAAAAADAFFAYPPYGRRGAEEIPIAITRFILHTYLRPAGGADVMYERVWNDWQKWADKEGYAPGMRARIMSFVLEECGNIFRKQLFEESEAARHME